MPRSELTKYFNAMEIPETHSSDYDTEHLREILITHMGDMFEDRKTGGKVSRKKGGSVRRKKGSTVSRRGGGKIMVGYKAGGKV